MNGQYRLALCYYWARGLHKPLLGGFFVPDDSLGIILLHASALFVIESEIVLCLVVSQPPSKGT